MKREMKSVESSQSDAEKKLKDRFRAFVEGRITSKSFRKATGRYILRGGRRDYSKYSRHDLAQMHAAGIPVKNPKQAAQIKQMHDAWAKKFGKAGE